MISQCLGIIKQLPESGHHPHGCIGIGPIAKTARSPCKRELKSCTGSDKVVACLFPVQKKEIGLTVHFVAPIVDTGDIVLQKKVPLQYDMAFGTDFEKFLSNYRDGLRQISAEMVAAAASMIANGEFSRTKQDVSLGKRYRLPVKKEKDEMRRRLALRIANG